MGKREEVKQTKYKIGIVLLVSGALGSESWSLWFSSAQRALPPAGRRPRRRHCSQLTRPPARSPPAPPTFWTSRPSKDLVLRQHVEEAGNTVSLEMTRHPLPIAAHALIVYVYIYSLTYLRIVLLLNACLRCCYLFANSDDPTRPRSNNYDVLSMSISQSVSPIFKLESVICH